MEKRDRLLLVVGLLVAGGAAAAGALLGPGEVDAPGPPDGGAPPPVRAVDRLRGLPGLRVPEGLPPPAAGLLRRVWEAAASGAPEEAAAALGDLAARAGDGDFRGRHAAVIAALAPALERLILLREGPIPARAMAAAASLAKAGGREGRAALVESRIVDGALGVQAGSGPPELRMEAIRLLGLVGGDRAVQWLVAMTGDGDTAVAERAVVAVGDAWQQGGRLPLDAILRVLAMLEAHGTPPAVRRACIGTADKAWESFRPYHERLLAPLETALADPETATRAVAATFLFNHPLQAAVPVLAGALGDAEPRVVESAAGALESIGPADPEVLEALIRCRDRADDPGVLRAVDRAVAAVRRALESSR